MSVAGIQQKRFNWLPKASAWQEMQSWRQKRQAVSESFANTSASVISNFMSTWDAQASVSTEITVSRVSTRLQAEYQARLSNLDSLQSSLDLTV
jgi:hypothetical protein